MKDEIAQGIWTKAIRSDLCHWDLDNRGLDTIEAHTQATRQSGTSDMGPEVLGARANYLGSTVTGFIKI